MNQEQFIYWLQGFVENNEGKIPTKEQWDSIVNHLRTVFQKVTPQLNPPFIEPYPRQDENPGYYKPPFICKAQPLN